MWGGIHLAANHLRCFQLFKFLAIRPWSKSRTRSEHPNFPTKNSTTKMGSQNGFDNHGHIPDIHATSITDTARRCNPQVTPLSSPKKLVNSPHKAGEKGCGSTTDPCLGVNSHGSGLALSCAIAFTFCVTYRHGLGILWEQSVPRLLLPPAFSPV